jgi:hypothetical protein
MIDSLRERLTKSMNKDPWDADQELAPESEVEETTELQTDNSVILATTFADSSPTNDVNSADYCKSIVKNAIEHGGRYNGHQIPITWLRMIEAGLEYRRVEPEMMWEEVEADMGMPAKGPAYDDMFHSQL